MFIATTTNVLNSSDIDTLSAVIAAIALLSSIISTFLSIQTSRKLGSVDFQSAERVKADTSELISTLRSVIYKGIMFRLNSKNLTIEHEKEMVSKFSTSTTGFAFHIWAAEKSRVASENGDQSEPWRTFQLRLTEILNATDPGEAVSAATSIQLMFSGLVKDDFETISDYLDDIPKALVKLESNIEHDIVMKVNRDLFANESKESELTTKAKLNFLKSKGVVDPDIDLFIAIDNDDAGLAKDALDRGASPNASLGEIWDRHQKVLEGFSE